MRTKKVDYLMDSKANSIGALNHAPGCCKKHITRSLHLRTESSMKRKRKSGKWHWSSVTKPGRICGHDVGYYLEIYHQVRQKTLEELQKRNDEWLLEAPAGRPSNYLHGFMLWNISQATWGQFFC